MTRTTRHLVVVWVHRHAIPVVYVAVAIYAIVLLLLSISGVDGNSI